MKTYQELFLRPVAGEGFSPERLAKVEAALVQDHRADMPWYLRVIVGIGAWLASLFFLGFVIALIGWQDEHQTTIGVLGLVLLVVAVLVGRQTWGVFVGQCALAVSLAAQAMIYYGLLNEQHHPVTTATIYSIVLAGVLYFAYPAFLSRLLTCLGALQLIYLWITVGDSGDLFSGNQRDSSAVPGLIFLYWAVQLAGICGCFLWPRRAVFLAPLGYALIGSLALWQVESLFGFLIGSTLIGNFTIWTALLFFKLRIGLTALALLIVTIWATGGGTIVRDRLPLFIGWAIALATLVVLGSGGVLLALLILLLGFSLQNRAILSVGLLLLPGFLTQYFYYLRLDLHMKSGVLIASGVLLLVVRAGLARWVFPKKAF